MKEIETSNFIAKNNEEYSFKLTVDNTPDDDSEYYIVELYDSQENKIGGLTLANVTQEKFSQMYGGKYGNIVFMNERRIADTGLKVEEGILKISDRNEYKAFIEDNLFLEDVSLKSNEREILTEIREFIKPEKELIKEKFNRPEIVSVYIPDGSEECPEDSNGKPLDLRGNGLGKKLYEYACQWMGMNNLKVHTQDLRSGDALNIWKAFRKDPIWNYGKDEHGEYIVRNDGIELTNEIKEILKKKQEELNPRASRIRQIR